MPHFEGERGNNSQQVFSCTGKIAVFLFCAFFLFFGLSRLANAATYTVCSSGCTSATIQNIFDSLDLAADDIVEIRADTDGGAKTYREAVSWGSNDGGSSGHPVILRGRTGDTITLHGDSDENGVDDIVTLIDVNNVDYIEIQNLTLTHPTEDGFQARGTSTGIVVRNATSTYSGNQAFQLENTASATYYNIVGSNNTDDGFSMHGTTTANIIGGTFQDNNQALQFIEGSNLTASDITIKGCLAECITFSDYSYGATRSVTLSSVAIDGTGGSFSSPLIDTGVGSGTTFSVDGLTLQNIPAGTATSLIKIEVATTSLSDFEITGNSGDSGVSAIYSTANSKYLSLSQGTITGVTNHYIDIYGNVSVIDSLLLIALPSGKYGVVARPNTNVTIKNVTISDGSDLNGKGIYAQDATVTTSIFNSIFSEMNVLLNSNGGSRTISNSILFASTSPNVGTWTYTNDIFSDPRFISTTTSNFTLSSTSPAIDAGTDAGLTADRAGNPIYGTPDIGAYEYQPPFTLGTHYIDPSGSIRIYGDRKYRYTTATSSTMSADLSVAPAEGSWTYGTTDTRPEWLNISSITWNTSGTYSKSWIASSTTATTTVYTIGGLQPSAYYTIAVDGLASTSLQSNISGKITYTYTGGYSRHTFTVTDTTAPTNTGISSISADSTTQLTAIAQTAVDAESELHSTPYYFNETSGNSGGSSSSWQGGATFTDIGLSPNTQYGYQVKAKDVNDNTSSYSTISYKYTLAPTPTNLSASSDSISVNLSVDSLPNATSGSSGYSFSNTTNGNNSGWIQTNSWQDTGLSCGCSYSYSVKYRNGDGTETDSVSTTKSTISCGGGGIFYGTLPVTIAPRLQTIYPNGRIVYHDEPASNPISDNLEVELPSSPKISSGKAILFTRTLKIKDKGTDVKSLQEFLNGRGFILAKSGAGAPGKETDYFGLLTKQAVIKFQEQYANEILKPWNLVRGTGLVGETTRKKINEILENSD